MSESHEESLSALALTCSSGNSTISVYTLPTDVLNVEIVLNVEVICDRSYQLNGHSFDSLALTCSTCAKHCAAWSFGSVEPANICNV